MWISWWLFAVAFNAGLVFLYLGPRWGILAAIGVALSAMYVRKHNFYAYFLLIIYFSASFLLGGTALIKWVQVSNAVGGALLLFGPESVFISGITLVLLALYFPKFLKVTKTYPADVIAAMNAGHIGLRYDGYLGLVNSDAPADVKALVKEVNAEWKTQYQAIATKRKTDLRSVEQTAGLKRVETAPPNTYTMPPNGQWVKTKR